MGKGHRCQPLRSVTWKPAWFAIGKSTPSAVGLKASGSESFSDKYFDHTVAVKGRQKSSAASEQPVALGLDYSVDEANLYRTDCGLETSS
jgi:hypothetical protein